MIYYFKNLYFNFFRGRQIRAERWDGKANYKVKESEEQRKSRIARFEQSLSEAKPADTDSSTNNATEWFFLKSKTLVISPRNCVLMELCVGFYGFCSIFYFHRIKVMNLTKIIVYSAPSL